MNSARILLCLILLSLSPGCSQPPVPEQRPAAEPRRRDLNVLLITIDTLRSDYLSCYGGQIAKTPNMDALAKRGVRFEQAIVQVPLTAPSHASILTGAYPRAHKVRDMGGFVLDPQIPTLATVLRESGRDTAAFIGAAVLNRYYGMNRGFAVYADDMKEKTAVEKLPGVVAEVRGEIVTRRALEWLESRSKQRPAANFLMWVHYYDPHFPYDPPEPFRSRHPKSRYAGEVAYTDDQVGRLLQGFSERDLLDGTLVVLTADHAESLGDHGEYTHGVFLYDSTVRVPMIVAGPGVPAGRIVTQQVRSIDVMPTIADFLGLSPGAKADGVSLVPAIVEGKGVRSNYCYMETLYPRTTMGWSELRGMRTDEWKLIVAPKPELYQIRQDRGESNNLVSKRPVEANQLQKKVWEVAGPPGGLGELKPQPIDEERRRELAALGYIGATARTLRLDMSGPDPKDRVEVLEALERAADAMNHDRFQAAVPILERILPRDPTNPLIYKQLGLSYQSLKQFDRAEQIYRKAMQHKVDSDATHAELGEIHVRRGELHQAVESMERAARLNPANLENLINMATAYLHLGQFDHTERVLRALLAQNPRYAAAHNLYGILDLQRGRALEARGHLERAVEIDPELAEPYMNLGLLAQNAGDTKSAIAYYRKFLKYAKAERYRDIIPKVRAALADLGASS